MQALGVGPEGSLVLGPARVLPASGEGTVTVRLREDGRVESPAPPPAAPEVRRRRNDMIVERFR